MRERITRRKGLAGDAAVARLVLEALTIDEDVDLIGANATGLEGLIASRYRNTGRQCGKIQEVAIVLRQVFDLRGRYRGADFRRANFLAAATDNRHDGRRFRCGQVKNRGFANRQGDIFGARIRSDVIGRWAQANDDIAAIGAGLDRDFLARVGVRCRDLTARCGMALQGGGIAGGHRTRAKRGRKCEYGRAHNQPEFR